MKLRGIFLLSLGVLFGACTILPEARESFYYAIEYESPPELPGAADLGVARIFETSVSPAYDRRQIVVRDDSPRYQYLNEDLWGVELRASMQMLLERYFEEVPTFQLVLGELARGSADYEIHSSIRRAEYVQGSPARARMEIVIEARTTDTIPQTVARHHLVEDETISEDGGLQEFASLINEFMLKAVYRFDEVLRNELGGERSES
ncbi:MAG: ABC-type transport auxiliary lipoprotein family protein [bacterium]